MFLKHLGFTILWSSFIALLSLVPVVGEAQDYGRGFDKVVHLFLYCFLATITIVGFSKQNRFPALKNNAVKMAILYSFIYGVLMECIQIMVPGRNFDLLDILYNSLGSILGFGLFYLIYKL